jgi:hypothetical protein
VQHHFDPGSDSDFNDPSGWNRASYTPDFLAELGEPIAEARNDYRAAAIYHFQLMFVVDEFITAAQDARFGIIMVAIVLGWPSARGWTIPEIASQIGCSPLTITRACARFREMAGLDADGAMQGIRVGAGPGNKPAVQA